MVSNLTMVQLTIFQLYNGVKAYHSVETVLQILIFSQASGTPYDTVSYAGQLQKAAAPP